MTNQNAIIYAVNANPGHTAHWYGMWGGSRCRWSWVYAAFERAERAGVIRSECHKGQTVYYPA